MSAALAIPMQVEAAYAAERLVDFNVPRGGIGAVVNAIARTANVVVALPASIASGQTAGPIVGRKSVTAALSEALAGTGLVLVASGHDNYIVKNGKAAAASGGAAGDIADIDVTGNGSQLHDDGFQAGDVGVVARLADTPAKEIPLTVSGVTHDVIQSESITNVADALQNVAGVAVAPSSTGAPTFTIRGFDNSNGYYADGARTNNLSGGIPIDDVERVDVLKGPTSILTGTTADGGLVNISTKKPTDQTIRDLTIRYGSYNYKTVAFDLGGIVPQTEGVTYRFVISGNNADKSYSGYHTPHEYLVAPSLQWKDKDTSVLVGFRYTDTKQVSPTTAFATLFTDTYHLVKVPRGVAEGGYNSGGVGKSITVFTDQSHDFGSLYGVDFTANNHLQYQSDSFNFNALNWSGDDFTNGTYGMTPLSETDSAQTVTERVDLTMKFDTGFFKQTSKIGFDASLLHTAQTSLAVYTPSAVDPLTGFDYVPLASFSNYGALTRSRVGSNVAGEYYLEKVDTLNDRLHILGSVRDDHFFSSADSLISYPGTTTTTLINSRSSQYGLSWTAGGAFDVTPWMTVYGNRNNGYTPQTGINAATGAALPPQSRDQSEVGARFFLFDKRLTLTTSFYKLLQQNVSQVDPTDPSGLRQILVGGLASRGFEFEAQGHVLPGLDLTAAFSTVHAAYTDPTVYANVVQAVPQINANIWATYSLQSGFGRGLIFGFGAHGNTSSTVGGYDGSFNSVNIKVPGYVVEDALVGYAKDNYSLTFKMNNLFDHYFYYPSIVPTAIIVGQGRNFVLTGKYSF